MNTTGYSIDGIYNAPPVLLGIWTQVTFVSKQATIYLYYEQNLVARSFLRGRNVYHEGSLYIGGHSLRVGVRGGGLDNMQIFNKALTIDEITILALANKDVMVD